MDNVSFKFCSAQLTSLVAASILLAASSQASAAYYTFTDLDTLGGSYSVARGINNVGQVVGESGISGDAARHATLWKGTTAIDLGTLGGTDSAAYGINDVGQVVGGSDISGNAARHATLWKGTTATDLGTLSGTLQPSIALGINDSGQIVGFSGIGDNILVQATLWNGATATTLGVFGGLESAARDINNSGQIVGDDSFSAISWNGTARTVLADGGIAYANNDSGQIVGGMGAGYGHATLWDGTTITDLGTLAGGLRSEANAINNSGQIVGRSGAAGVDGMHATLWDGTTITDLNSVLDANAVSAGWVLTAALGINDNGAIVGAASNSQLNIDSHAFLITPIPEPQTYGMLLAGLGLVGFMARRRKAE